MLSWVAKNDLLATMSCGQLRLHNNSRSGNGADNRPVLHVDGGAILKVRTFDGKDCGVIGCNLCHLGICDVNGFWS